MKVIIEKDISYYATPEQFAGITDDDIIEMCMEDLTDLVDNAEWTIIRGGDA